jgi:hypothetical protein
MRARFAVPTAARPLLAGAAATGALVILLGVATVVLAPPASAHGPNGLFQPQKSSVVAPLTVAFRVRLIYSNDTDPVTSGATVTVRGSGPGGSVGPVAMGYTGSDGYYTATVTFPAGGNWTMTFLSQNPAAQYVQTETVPSPAPAPTEPPPTVAPQPTAAPPSSEAPVTTAPEAAVPESTTTTALSSTTASTAPDADAVEIAASPVSAQSDAGYDYLLVVVGALAAAVALGATSLFAWRGANR